MKQKQSPVPVAPAPWHFLSLEEWRQSPTRVEWLASLQKDVTFREFLGMLHKEATTRSVAMPLTAESIAVEFGRSEGRADVLQWVELAAVSSLPSGSEAEILNYGVPDPSSEKPQPLQLT